VVTLAERLLKTELHYVENATPVISFRNNEEIEATIEEERENIQKVKVSTRISGKTVSEMVIVVPRLHTLEIPIVAHITAKPPSGLILVKLPMMNEVFTEVKVPSLLKLAYPLQRFATVFTHKSDKFIEPLLPLFEEFIYSYYKEHREPLTLTLQADVRAFTSKRLLALMETLFKVPMISEDVKARDKFQPLASTIVILQSRVKAKLLGSTRAIVARGLGLLEILFPEEKEKIRGLVSAASEYVGEPIIVILPKSSSHLWYLFWVICRELYREARGSYPEPVILLGEKSSDSAEYWLKLYRSLSGKILIIDESCIKSTKGVFKRRLPEAFSQGLGFIVVLADNVNDAEKTIKELCNPYIPRIISIEKVPEIGYILDRSTKIISSCFGLVIMSDELDRIIAEVDRKYRDFINELLTSEYVAYVRRDISEHESEEHVAMKALVIKVLREEYNIRPEKICCTCPIDNIVADIYVEDKKLAVECETMFEVAPAPYIKIFETVRKYAVRKGVNEVWVVIRNWPILIHLGDLVWAEELLKNEFKQLGINIRFLVPDISRKTLRALDEIFDEIVEGTKLNTSLGFL
jgi:hypothetical protein